MTNPGTSGPRRARARSGWVVTLALLALGSCRCEPTPPKPTAGAPAAQAQPAALR